MRAIPILLALLLTLAAGPAPGDSRDEKLRALLEKLESLQSELATLKTPSESPEPATPEADPEPPRARAVPLSTPELEVVAFANGDRYVGELEQGMPHGIGTYQAASGRELRGEFRNGQPHGRITAALADGTFVTGHFEDGTFQGTVELRTPEGIVYEGFRLTGGNRRLVIVYPDGRRYRGAVSADRATIEPHGRGRMVWPDGRVQDGTFEAGEFIE